MNNRALPAAAALWRILDGRVISAAIVAFLSSTATEAIAANAASLAVATGFAIETRYESLDGGFRNGAPDDDQILVNRLELSLGRAWQTDRGAFKAQFELWDARAFLHDDDTPLDTGEVNALEPVNAWVSWSGDFGELRAGRLTEDLGSRRLVARNIYRNTTNTFTGIDWRGDLGSWRAQAFIYSPDRRLPARRDRVDDDEFKYDEASLERLLYGLYAQRQVTDRDKLELYAYHLDENDTDDAPSRNRRITTPGARWVRSAPEGGLDAELEVALQFGKVRETPSATDISDIDHRAALVHGELGWRPSATGPRTSLEVAWASGDDDPSDNDNETFDSLAGVIVGDYGPSGIWTAVTRSNMFTATARIDGRPMPGVHAHALVRHIRLPSAADTWFGARLRDPTGNSGDEVGTQFETRVRWWAIPDQLRLEGGWVHFARGDFATDAPGAPRGDTVDYFWFATRIIF